ncbi:hypothetical protein J6590_066672 [Homalodisca vitripennis]|nr:hypothetical protein J6590_066672 [Homalodisca vitripennis]
MFSSRWSASVPRGLQAGRTDATRCRKGFNSLPVDSSPNLLPAQDHVMATCVDTYTSVAALGRGLVIAPSSHLGQRDIDRCNTIKKTFRIRVGIYTQAAGTAGGRTDATRCRKRFTSLPVNSNNEIVNHYRPIKW